MDAASGVASGPDSGRAVEIPAGHRWDIKILRQLSLAIAIYGMVEWIYVAICSLTAPDTLALPLTHLLPWLREDTSGAISFVLSFAGFVTYRMTRPG